MITSYGVDGQKLELWQGFITEARLRAAAWIDLVDPTPAEEQHVEGLVGVDLPTREEMREIEDSSRIYAAGGALYLTATVMVNSDSESPRTGEITFVLVGNRLVTVRYAEPKAFRLFSGRLERQPELGAGADSILVGLLDALVERLSDGIERVGDDLENLVHEVLAPDAQAGGRPRRLDHAAMLRRLERAQSVTTKARASLVSLNRALVHLTGPEVPMTISPAARERARAVLQDVRSVVDHASFLAANISFELAAILGMVNIEQNRIIKILSVAAVVFLPPTLVASIYGMNFDFMPELRQAWGYPVVLAVMVMSAALPYVLFKRKGWL